MNDLNFIFIKLGCSISYNKLEAVIIEAGAFEASNRYNNRTSATPSSFILVVSDDIIFAKTGGITVPTVSKKSKLLVI